MKIRFYIAILIMMLSGICLFSQKKVNRDSLLTEANTYYNRGEADIAVMLFRQVLYDCEQKKDLACQAEMYRKIGDSHRAIGDHMQALSQLRKAAQIAAPLGDSLLTARILNRFSALYFEWPALDSAEYYAQSSYALTLAKKDWAFTANNLNLLGAIAKQKNDLPAAVKYLTESIEMQKTGGDLTDVPNAMNNLGLTYMEQKNFREAIRIAGESMDMAQKNNIKPYMQMAALIMMQSYEALGDYKTALSYYRTFNVYKDSIYNDAVTRRIAELTEDFRRDSIQRENDRLNMERDLLAETGDLKDATIRNRSIMLVSLLALLVMSLVLIALQVKSRRQAQASQREIELQKKEIELQKEKLQESNQIKDRLFSVIAHDLRSPLNSLQGILNLVRSGYIGEEELKRMTATLTSRVDYTSMLVENLLNWAKSQLEGFQSNPEKVDVFDLAEDQVNLVSAAAEAKRIQLSHSVPKGTWVRSDRNMADLMLRNLISNAVKFTRNGGQVSVFCTTSEGKVFITVQDNGVGIPPENLEKLFGKDHYSTMGTAREKGSGLGLMLVKEFAEKNGGELNVRSVPGEGSAFTVSLPVY